MTLTAYEVHYTNRDGEPRTYCTYAQDAYTAKISAEELIQPGFKITRITPVPDFDW